MYRSRSTSSVYFDSILNNNNNSDGQSWNDQPTSEQQHRYSHPNGTGLSLTLPRPRTDVPPHEVTRNNLTSALTGSRMATTDGIPSGPSRRPLPKALLPKSARATPTPSAMYGSSLGLNSSSVVRQDSSSGSSSPTVVKSPAALTLEQRFSVQRMESTPVGGTMLSPAVHTPTATESGRWSTLGRRPHTAGVNPPGSSSTLRPYGVSADASGRDGWSSGRSHPLAASWNPPVNATPVRRREAVVQDSIVPFLKAALGKDNDPQNTRMQKEEESVNRQVFGRRNAGTGTLRTVSMYGSTDDIFGKSNSQLQLTPFAESTIPRVHLKSHSEVLAPRWNEEDLQRRAMRNSMSSAVSSSDIRGTRTPGTPGVQEMTWNEPRSYNGGHAKHPSSTRQVLSYQTQPTPADQNPSSWSNNSSRSTSNFVHSNGARPPPARTPSWDDETPPPPPLSAPPISSSHPTHNNYHTSTGRQMSTVNMDDPNNSWYDPIPVTPRNIIRSPSVVFMDSPRDLKDTKRSSRSMVFFGESFSPASYPLLAKVERDVLDGEGGGEVDPAVNRRHHSRTNGSKSTNNLTTGFGWKEPASTSSLETNTSRNFNGFSRDISDISPAAPIVVSVQHRTCGVENLTMPSPPLEFRDEAPLPAPSLPSTTTPATTTTVPPLPVSHQATDSMNTEDSGLERWEKDGNDHSADEQDVMAVHRTSSTTSTTGRRSSSALTKKRSGSWHEEDTSEGRGSLSSSPRPHNSDEHRSTASPTDDPYLTIANNSGRFADENVVPSNSILRQLLAENARHTTREFDESTHNNYSSKRDSRSLASHLDHSNNSIDSEPSLPPPPLPPSCPPPSDFDSDANGSALGIDSESNHSYSTTVQSSATLSGGGTAEPGERSRSTEDGQREHGRDMLRGWAAEDAVKEEGWSREKRAVAGDANLDRSDASMRLTGSREMQNSQQRIAFEATNNYGSERLISETIRRGGSEEVERGEDGERMVIDIVKGPVGVGFCIEGGKGSLSGDRPIAVKRVFKGGSIDGTANLLRPGDELLSIGGQSLVGLSHYEAWRFIKGLPNGTFPLAIRRRKPTNQQPPAAALTNLCGKTA